MYYIIPLFIVRLSPRLQRARDETLIAADEQGRPLIRRRTLVNHFVDSGIRMPAALLLFTIASSFSISAAGESPVHLLQPSILYNKSYTEIYTLTAENDNGTFVQVQFTFTNLGIQNENAACKALVLHTSQKPWKVNERFSRKQWSYADTPNPVLSMGSNTVTLLQDKVILRATVGGANWRSRYSGALRRKTAKHGFSERLIRQVLRF